MVMTIRNTCRMFDNLFQFVRNREMKRLNSPNISVGGFEPVIVVYIGFQYRELQHVGVKTAKFHGKK